jgi:hypothetical protein
VLESSALTKAAVMLADEKQGERLGKDIDGMDGRSSFISLLLAQMLYDRCITDVEVIDLEVVRPNQSAAAVLEQVGATFESMPEYNGDILVETVFDTLLNDYASDPIAWPTHASFVPHGYGIDPGWPGYMRYERFSNALERRITDLISDRKEKTEGRDQDLKSVGLATIYVVRGILYASRAFRIAATEGAACSYISSPGRLKALAKFIDSKELERNAKIERMYSRFVDSLPLPQGGYDLSILAREMNPLMMSEVSQYFLAMRPREALDVALRFRERDDVRFIRAAWRDAVHRLGSACCEEATTSQAVFDSNVGTLNQTVVQNFHVLGTANGFQDRTGASPMQSDIEEARRSLKSAVAKGAMRLHSVRRKLWR